MPITNMPAPASHTGVRQQRPRSDGGEGRSDRGGASLRPTGSPPWPDSTPPSTAPAPCSGMMSPEDRGVRSHPVEHREDGDVEDAGRAEGDDDRDGEQPQRPHPEQLLEARAELAQGPRTPDRSGVVRSGARSATGSPMRMSAVTTKHAAVSPTTACGPTQTSQRGPDDGRQQPQRVVDGREGAVPRGQLVVAQHAAHDAGLRSAGEVPACAVHEDHDVHDPRAGRRPRTAGRAG